MVLLCPKMAIRLAGVRINRAQNVTSTLLRLLAKNQHQSSVTVVVQAHDRCGLQSNYSFRTSFLGFFFSTGFPSAGVVLPFVAASFAFDGVPAGLGMGFFFGAAVAAAGFFVAPV